MTFEPLFAQVTALLPEPVLLLAADARVLSANPAAHRLVAGLADRPPLAALVTEDADRVALLVRRWLRTGDPVPAGLTFNARDGDRIRARCFGARARWMPDGVPAVHLRAVRLDRADRFVGLTERFLGRQRENALRQHAVRLQCELSAAEARLDRALEFGRDLAEADSAARVAQVVAATVPEVLRCAAAFLDVDGGDAPRGAGGEVVRTPVRRHGAVLGDLVTLGAPDTRRHDDVAAQVAHALARVAGER